MSKKWSSFKEQQLITENFRKWLEEEPVEEGVFDTVKAGGKKLFAKITGSHKKAVKSATWLKQHEEQMSEIWRIITEIKSNKKDGGRFDFDDWESWKNSLQEERFKEIGNRFLKSFETADLDVMKKSDRGIKLLELAERLASGYHGDQRGLYKIILSTIEESKGWAEKSDEHWALTYAENSLESITDFAKSLSYDRSSGFSENLEEVVKHGKEYLGEPEHHNKMQEKQFFLALCDGKSEVMERFYSSY